MKNDRSRLNVHVSARNMNMASMNKIAFSTVVWVQQNNVYSKAEVLNYYPSHISYTFHLDEHRLLMTFAQICNSYTSVCCVSVAVRICSLKCSHGGSAAPKVRPVYFQKD